MTEFQKYILKNHPDPDSLLEIEDKFEQMCRLATNFSKHQIKESLRIMRDLAEHQNGPPLIKHEEEYNKTMKEVWDFLKVNET